MTHGTHNALPDPRNENVLIYINGDLVPRAEAKISVFDSGYLVGDGVWEGVRLHHGVFVFLDEHLDRLFQGAKAIAMNIGLTRAELSDALYQTVRANNMHDNVHARLMVTRGIKKTPSQDPRLTISPPNIVIIAEHKVADPDTVNKGIRLHTSTVRRGSPDYLDPRLNCHSKLHEVIALVQALEAGADEALMLDIHGFVSTCNATNFFIVRKGEVWTSTGQYCMNGITRGKIIEICAEQGIVCRQKNFSLTDVYDADEAFVTGTFGGLTPVIAIDGRTIGNGALGAVTQQLTALYRARIDAAVRTHAAPTLVAPSPQPVATEQRPLPEDRAPASIPDSQSLPAMPQPAGRSTLFSRRSPAHEARAEPALFRSEQPTPEQPTTLDEFTVPPAFDPSPTDDEPSSPVEAAAQEDSPIAPTLTEPAVPRRHGLFRTVRTVKESTTSIFTTLASPTSPHADEAEAAVSPAMPAHDHTPTPGISPSTAVMPTVTKVSIFHTNDMHGHLSAMTKLSAFAKQECGQAERQGHTVFFWDAGDAADRRVKAVSVTKGVAFMPILNAMGYTLQTMGNALALPYGPQAMTAVAECANFPILAANCRDGDGPLIEGLRESVLIPLPGGTQMGVFGLTAPWDGFYEIYGLHFPDYIPLARQIVAGLRDQGATLIIALSHLGLDDDRRLAQEVEGIDLIIGGHSHHRLPQGIEHNGALITQTGEYGEALGRIDLVIDNESGTLRERRAMVLPVPAEQTPDPAVVDAIEAAETEVKSLLARPIGVLLGMLELDHFAECGLGNFTADALRERMKADAAIVASGLFNQGIPVGTVTFGQLDAASFASANPCATLVRGEQILEALERGLDPAINKQKPLGFRGNQVGIPQISGMSVECAPDSPAGSRIRRVLINDAPLDADGHYRLAHTDAETAPDYGYLVLDPAQQTETEVPTILREVMEEYLSENAPLLPPTIGRWQAL